MQDDDSDWGGGGVKKNSTAEIFILCRLFAITFLQIFQSYISSLSEIDGLWGKRKVKKMEE